MLDPRSAIAWMPTWMILLAGCSGDSAPIRKSNRETDAAAVERALLPLAALGKRGGSLSFEVPGTGADGVHYRVEWQGLDSRTTESAVELELSGVHVESSTAPSGTRAEWNAAEARARWPFAAPDGADCVELRLSGVDSSDPQDRSRGTMQECELRFPVSALGLAMDSGLGR